MRFLVAQLERSYSRCSFERYKPNLYVKGAS